jgi:aminoglycoside phosphotransferase (APT) family kinase protein
LNGHDRYARRLIRELRGYAPDAERSVLIDAAEAAYARHHTVLAYQVGPRLIRGDLHLSNVIVVDNHVTGIDWKHARGDEPDLDLAHLIRWAVYPADAAEVALERSVTAADYLPLIDMLLEAYHEVAGVPALATRMLRYQVEHGLQAC